MTLNVNFILLLIVKENVYFNLSHYLFQMALLISIKLLLGTEFGAFTEALKPEIDKLFLGTISLPIKLLSSNYRRALQVL